MPNYFTDEEIQTHIDYLADAGNMNAAMMLTQLLNNKKTALGALRHVVSEHKECEVVSGALEEIIFGGVEHGIRTEKK
jgi:hypothetical protein